MRLTNRETATVLAALRYWQERLPAPGDALGMEFLSSGEHFDRETPLNSDELDALCERINMEKNQL